MRSGAPHNASACGEVVHRGGSGGGGCVGGLLLCCPKDDARILDAHMSISTKHTAWEQSAEKVCGCV